MKTKDTDRHTKLLKDANKKVKDIFKKHGLCTYRRIGLQKSFKNALIEAAIKGEVL